jgi:hypothetical protein
MWYRAPWGKRVHVLSWLAVVTLGLISGHLFLTSAGVVGLVPLVILALPLAWMVTGYRMSDGVLHVRRLGWTTRIRLDQLESAEVTPNAMRGSWRAFGIGGAYSMSGLFSNAELGRYRAFVTDEARTVVLTFATDTVVVSPHQPEAFVREILRQPTTRKAAASSRSSDAMSS